MMPDLQAQGWCVLLAHEDLAWYCMPFFLDTSKNGFSDLTKEQIGWDQCRKDIMNDLWEKALKQGCCEREQGQTDVSSTEKTNTKEDLARVTPKSRSKTQTVTNGHVSKKGDESCCFRVFQCQRPCRVSEIEA